MVRVEQGGTAKWDFNATDGTVENMTTTIPSSGETLLARTGGFRLAGIA